MDADSDLCLLVQSVSLLCANGTKLPGCIIHTQIDATVAVT